MLKRAILILMLSFFLFPTNALSNDREKGLKKALAYLKEIQEIGWVKFDKNNVYIGWKSYPADLKYIVNAAATIGHKAIGFGIHIYNYMGETIKTDGSFFCTVTKRHGKFKENTCTKYDAIN